jgi:hypothetical protein
MEIERLGTVVVKGVDSIKAMITEKRFKEMQNRKLQSKIFQ